MKWCIAYSILFTSSVTNAFVISPSQTSTVASKTCSRSSTFLSAAAQLTRFDRLKQKYKGPKNTVEVDSNLPFSYEEFDEAVQTTEYSFNRNDIVKGTIVQHDKSGAIIDIGAKASAFLPPLEVSLIPPEYGERIEDTLALDSEHEVMIISEEDENGQLLVSIKRIQYRQAWEKIQEMQASDEVFEAVVVGVNRGGAICLVEGLRAFLPGSHLTGQLPTEELIGQTIPLKFLEVNTEINKIVVSNRRAVVEQQMKELSRGDVIQGVVKALKPYGAFVEVGGMSGLLHISQISYDRIDDLERVLEPGTVIKCMIIDHDKVNGRIALSTKTLEPEPGDMLKDSAKVFELADETAKKYHERMEAERRAREQSAKDIVIGLGRDLDSDEDDDDDDADPLNGVTDSLDSILTS